jgi:Clr5-like protein
MTISTEEWNDVRAQVEDFYYVQKLSMSRVVEMMKARGFKAR